MLIFGMFTFVKGITLFTIQETIYLVISCPFLGQTKGEERSVEMLV
jgi:hypothetical protein